MKRRRWLHELSGAAPKSEVGSGARPARSAYPSLSASILAIAALHLFACQHPQVSISCPPGAKLMGAAPPKGGEIWCQESVAGKAVKNGPFIVYSTDGGKMIEGNYRNGVQDGEWTLWYENGARASIDHYVNGRQNGPHMSWYANGQEALEGEYQNGSRQGVWTQWDPNGLSSRKMIYRGGEVER